MYVLSFRRVERRVELPSRVAESNVRSSSRMSFRRVECLFFELNVFSSSRVAELNVFSSSRMSFRRFISHRRVAFIHMVQW